MLPEEETKLCPFCREIIRASAIKCRFCGEWLEQSTSSADPITAVRRALAAKFKIMGQLGHGGMSVLYRASEIKTGREVALKVLPLHLSGEKEYVGRFHREASALSKLNHPNIIKIYEEGVENGVHFMSMEFLEGRDLHKLLVARGPITSEEAADVLAPIARALDYAHKNTLVHRDVKSSNIFITREGRPVLTDFGIAHLTNTENQLTVTGTVIGTPEFMSPEQAEGREIDGRADIYSLGVVMYNAVTGRFPYHGDTPLTTIYKIINETHTPVKEIKNLPGWMEFAIEACLEKDPERRIRTGNALSEILTKRKIPEGEYKKDLMLETIKLKKEDMEKVLSKTMSLRTEEETPETVLPPRPGNFNSAKQKGNGNYKTETSKRKKIILPAFIVASFLMLAAAIGITVYNRYSQNLMNPLQKSSTVSVNKSPETSTAAETKPNPEPKDNTIKPEKTETLPDNSGIVEVPDNTGSVNPPAQKVTVPVPNLEGLTLQEASGVLRRRGLRSGVVTRITSTAANYNLVLRQIPKPGRRLNEGATVNLIVGD